MREEPRPISPHQLSSMQVLVRLALRLILLTTFASFSTHGFGTSWAAFLALAAVFCAVVGLMRREALFGSALTHWDEAAAYAALGALVTAVA